MTEAERLAVTEEATTLGRTLAAVAFKEQMETTLCCQQRVQAEMLRMLEATVAVTLDMVYREAKNCSTLREFRERLGVEK